MLAQLIDFGYVPEDLPEMNAEWITPNDLTFNENTGPVMMMIKLNAGKLPAAINLLMTKFVSDDLSKEGEILRPDHGHAI